MCRAAIAMTQLERKGSLLTILPTSRSQGVITAQSVGKSLKINLEKEWSPQIPGFLSPGWEEYH